MLYLMLHIYLIYIKTTNIPFFIILSNRIIRIECLHLISLLHEQFYYYVLSQFLYFFLELLIVFVLHMLIFLLYITNHHSMIIVKFYVKNQYGNLSFFHEFGIFVLLFQLVYLKILFIISMWVINQLIISIFILLM